MQFRSILALLFLFIGLSLFAQKTNFNITGVVTDTLGEPLISSTILLLEKQDSTMVEFTKSELSGEFIFKNIPAGDYLVKTTYIGYIPTSVDASAHDGKNINLGNVQMSELAEELMTVVIKAAKAPIKMRGDTIEYDATTFQVPEGSTVEDLLKRLPGIEVESDGSILADGKNVNKVTVDGKSFFGSSPQAATKNLPAEGIGKVQVFDTKSEQEEITGATSEAKEKTMNLTLKEEFKKGAFGKVIASVGTEDRLELKGNYNKFNKKIQFSLVGVGNNTGRNGLSWDDYQDFMGAQAWNFGGNTDYGFGGGNNRYFSFGGSSGGIESSIRSVFFNNSSNQGLPENINGGLNFNYDHKKNKVSAVYYYNQAGIIKDGTSSGQTFFQNNTTSEESVNTGDDISFSHRAEFELSKEIDSLHFVKFSFNGAQINENEMSNEFTSRRSSDGTSSIADIVNDVDTEGGLANGLLLLRKKFKKKGRSLGLNSSILYTELREDWSQESNTRNVDTLGIERVERVNQSNSNIRDKLQFKANALYVEPIAKKFFWQTFYNHSNRQETGDRVIQDNEQNELVLNEGLSRIYDNSIILNRVGTSIRYSHNGINLSLGLAYQNFDLAGEFSGGQNGIVDRRFDNWVPDFSFDFEPFSNSYAGVYFSRSANEPSIEDLQPVINNLNPLYIVVGNSALTPEISNNYSADFSKSYPLSGTRFNVRVNFNNYDNQFSRDIVIDSNLVSTVTPINVEGGTNFEVNSGVSFPIIKNKITTRFRITVRDENKISFINGEENDTRTISYNPYLRFNITPIENIGIYLTARVNFRDTRYDVNPEENQSIVNETYSVEFSAKTVWDLLFSANLDYERYNNDRFDLQRDIPVLDLSVSRPFLKKNRMEARLSLFDVFNQNVGFSSSDSFQSENVILGQYLLFSLTYNIRGVKSSAQKDSWY